MGEDSGAERPPSAPARPAPEASSADNAEPKPTTGSPTPAAIPGVVPPVEPPATASKLQRALHEVAKFGVVGAIAYVVDVGLFNLFRFGLDVGPLTSKTISTVVAVTVAYYGNRNWTWRERTRSGFRREYLLFFLVNGAGLAIQLAVLGFTVYVLRMDGQLAENISGNVIGVLLGTLFRFWAYRTWVFPQVQGDPHSAEADEALEATTTTPY